MLYELDCRYDTRNSFYGKAQVQETINKNVKNIHNIKYV